MIKRKTFVLTANGKTLELGKITRVMGIVNVTPDSFSGDGTLKSRDPVRLAVKRALQMVRDGADIIDIGGESTRPMASPVSAGEEIRRVIPVIEALSALKISAVISVDTSKTAVARQALRSGAGLVNVVQGNALTAGLLNEIRRCEAGIVVMHMRGTPRTMGKLAHYSDLIPEVIGELGQALKTILDSGINKDSVVIDPGIGFAKTADQNLRLLKDLHLFRRLGFPILVGPSRKSFIGKVLGIGPDRRLPGSIAASVASVIQGAHIVRVHDVVEIKQAVMIADAIFDPAPAGESSEPK